jgi:hypothetical protein
VENIMREERGETYSELEDELGPKPTATKNETLGE